MTSTQLEEQHLPHIDEGAELDLEQFRLHSRAEIARVLRDVAKSGELVTAYFNNQDFLLTTVIAADPDTNRLLLDYGPDEATNQRLLRAERAIFVSRHYQVRVQFTASGISRCDLQDGPAFLVPFPDSMLRVQRREFYRLTTPISARPECLLEVDDGTELRTQIMDISLGGVGILETDLDRDDLWEQGRIFKNCHITLPEHGVIVSDIEVRNRYEVSLPNGRAQYRIGCRFLQLNPRMNADIQRYIHRVDLERRRLAKG